MLISKTRADLRCQAQRKRAALSPDFRAKAEQMMLEHLMQYTPFFEARTVSCYLSFGNEAMTGALINHCWQEGKTVVIPQLAGKDMFLVDYTPQTKLKKHPQLGFDIPSSQQPTTHTIDLLIIPTVAFDAYGNRLGYGKGFYDRFLAKTAPCHRLGLAFSVQMVTKIPALSTDIALDYFLTEQGFITTLSQNRTLSPASPSPLGANNEQNQPSQPA